MMECKGREMIGKIGEEGYIEEEEEEEDHH